MNIMSIITTIMSSLNITSAALAPILGSTAFVFAGWTAASFIPFGYFFKKKGIEK